MADGTHKPEIHEAWVEEADESHILVRSTARVARLNHKPQLPHPNTAKHHHPHATHENTRLDRTTRTTGRSKLNPITTRQMSKSDPSV